MSSRQSFQLASTHKSFNDKQKDLFKELDKVTVLLPQDTEAKIQVDGRDNKFHYPSLKQLRGKESIFKRPEIPLRRCLPRSKIPDFQKHPDKWTKYSLHDVKDEDMSELSNKKAALSFLKELENRTITDENAMDSFPNKITFQKSMLISNIVDSESKYTFRNSKLVMPEYSVGQKIKKEKKNKEKRSGHSSKQLMLSHLMTEDEEN